MNLSLYMYVINYSCTKKLKHGRLEARLPTKPAVQIILVYVCFIMKSRLHYWNPLAVGWICTHNLRFRSSTTGPINRFSNTTDRSVHFWQLLASVTIFIEMFFKNIQQFKWASNSWKILTLFKCVWLCYVTCFKQTLGQTGRSYHLSVRKKLFNIQVQTQLFYLPHRWVFCFLTSDIKLSSE